MEVFVDKIKYKNIEGQQDIQDIQEQKETQNLDKTREIELDLEMKKDFKDA